MKEHMLMNEQTLSANSERFPFAKAGVYLLGLATILAGILDLIWGEFDASHQPFGALGDHVPGRLIFAYITAVWLILAGAAIFWRRTARAGSLATAIIYFVFGLFWLPRFYTVPHILGFRFTVLMGLLGQMFLQLMVVAGALVLYVSFAPSASSRSQRVPVVARWTIGVGSVLCGLGHLAFVKVVAPMIPKWMPLGAAFWVVISGIAFLLAGLAILSGVLNVLAARLLGVMLLVFEVALVPLLFANPRVHIAWGANAYNLAAAGAVWLFAASIASRHAHRAQAVSESVPRVA